MITIYLREVHYRIVTVCDICWLFTAMNAPSVLDHHSGCTAMCDKECVEQEGQQKVKKVTQKEVKGPRGKRRHPNYPAQRSPRSHKEWNATQHLPI